MFIVFFVIFTEFVTYYPIHRLPSFEASRWSCVPIDAAMPEKARSRRWKWSNRPASSRSKTRRTPAMESARQTRRAHRAGFAEQQKPDRTLRAARAWELMSISARTRVRRPAKGGARVNLEGTGGLSISYYSESRGVVCVVDIRVGKFGGARVVHGVVHDYSRVARARRALRGARDMCMGGTRDAGLEGRAGRPQEMPSPRRGG